MKIGTKSILFGVHQFILHPVMVVWAWWIIYRKPPRLFELCAIVTHDWGYWGCSNMDGVEGEAHPVRSAMLWKGFFRYSNFGYDIYDEIMGHSRFNAAKHNMKLSKLFKADKLAMALYPRWLYLLLGNLTGEIKEYMDLNITKEGKYCDIIKAGKTQAQWLIETQAHMALMGLHGKDYGPVARQMEGKCE